MRIIAGAPAAEAGAQPVVLLTIDAKPQVLEGDFGWGKNIKAAALAKAILMAVGVEETRAVKLHRRFLWRTVRNWPESKPFAISGEEVMAVVREIEATEASVAPGVIQAADRERPPVASEAGGFPGAAFSEVENKG